MLVVAAPEISIFADMGVDVFAMSPEIGGDVVNKGGDLVEPPLAVRIVVIGCATVFIVVAKDACDAPVDHTDRGVGVCEVVLLQCVEESGDVALLQEKRVVAELFKA